METNESILTREIVSIDDRKRLGKMKDLCVDFDTRAVSHYIVNSATTNSALVLPFDKSLAVGDTFMTIQSREDFVPPSEDEAKDTLKDGYRLIGAEVFSQNGNRLGTVEGFEFDTTHGTVTKIILGKRLAFDADSFVFFAPEFVFVDDGEATAFEVRNGLKGGKTKKKSAPKIFSKAPRKTAVKEEAAPVEEEAPAPVEEAAPVVEEAAPAPVEEVEEAPVVEEVVEEVVETEVPVDDVADEDEVLKEFLIDSVVSDDVTSKDGEFKIEKGTKLTKELVEEAQKHDALLLLTMSVES